MVVYFSVLSDIVFDLCVQSLDARCEGLCGLRGILTFKVPTKCPTICEPLYAILSENKQLFALLLCKKPGSSLVNDKRLEPRWRIFSAWN